METSTNAFSFLRFAPTGNAGIRREVTGNTAVKNRSPKGNMWSAIPVALLCMVANRNERKQGSGTEGDKVL